ncbi:hypothetical protein SLEP1_g38458 [Rubroshorea leprosula]|nr:hypothetical protein SLEP1_g38458 [Rubroshorea leprosula]
MELTRLGVFAMRTLGEIAQTFRQVPRCYFQHLIIPPHLKRRNRPLDYQSSRIPEHIRSPETKDMTMGTSTAQAYGEPQYWDDRYANESAPFDWYQKYPSLAPLIRLYVPHNHQRILVVGCGNSAFSEDMVDDGYEDVVNVDISSVVIKAMQNKYQNRSQLKYIEMDVKDMSAFEAGSFDAVIDKGTLDSILCGSNGRHNSTQMLEEIGRYNEHKTILQLFCKFSFMFLLDMFMTIY